MGVSEGYFGADGLPIVDEPDLATWLLAAIAEDERIARDAASPSPWMVDDQQRDDRAIYGAARGATVAYDPSGDEDSKRHFAHIARWDPARVLAECDAKRRIVEAHRSVRRTCLGDESNPAAWRDLCPTCGSGEPYEYPVFSPCDTLKLLALVYVDRPGYRSEWKP
jgi:hypothetical protein